MSDDISIKTIIFDLDGTLIDSAPGILRCFSHVLEKNGLPSVAMDISLIGPPLKETLSLISGVDDERRLEIFIDDFKQCYDGGVSLQTPFYDGVLAVLEQLSARGIDLHIATNKRLLPSIQILEKHQCRHCFQSVYALDMVQPRIANKTALLKYQLEKESISPEKTLYIGDKAEDGEAADANHLQFYYADWGYGDLLREQCPSPWKWLNSLERLLEML